MIELGGETRIFPIVGDPIAQVRSPKLLTEIMEVEGINGIAPPLKVKHKDIERFFSTIEQTQNIDGLVVTLPHKTAALAFCDQVTNRASIIGSVNITRRFSDGRFVGDNTDGEPYVTAVRNCGGNPEGKRVIQIGVGGAGSAVAYEFLAQATRALGCKASACADMFDAQALKLVEFMTDQEEQFLARFNEQVKG